MLPKGATTDKYLYYNMPLDFPNTKSSISMQNVERSWHKCEQCKIESKFLYSIICMARDIFCSINFKPLLNESHAPLLSYTFVIYLPLSHWLLSVYLYCCLHNQNHCMRAMAIYASISYVPTSSGPVHTRIR